VVGVVHFSSNVFRPAGALLLLKSRASRALRTFAWLSRASPTEGVGPAPEAPSGTSAGLDFHRVSLELIPALVFSRAQVSMWPSVFGLFRRLLELSLSSTAFLLRDARNSFILFFWSLLLRHGSQFGSRCFLCAIGLASLNHAALRYGCCFGCSCCQRQLKSIGSCGCPSSTCGLLQDRSRFYS
jgi:hypothetical protein